ncbi:MAG: TlpA disulfide reductase family protein [Brachybacterium sp.]|nr:TlpA disulfide reductase family protein [Brachybacterium sp.]
MIRRPHADAPGRRRVLLGAGTALSALVLAACGTDTSDRYDTGFVSGDGVATEISPEDRGEALEFSGTTYQGETWDLTDHRQEVVVLNVWYAACAPCRAEAPDLKEIAEQYAEQDVTFLGINVRDEAGPAQAFERTYEIPYPSVPDLDAQIMYRLRGQVAPNAVPSTLVLDREGRVAARISGAIEPGTLRAMIERVLEENDQ